MVDEHGAAAFRVLVQETDFDIAQLQYSLLAGANQEGAIATFTGYVRSDNEQRDVAAMHIEHYPGMTERSIYAILMEARERWPILAAVVVHRVGKLQPGDQIVWVGVSSAHREAAFAASEFVMDYLKTRAPFWKKEVGSKGEHWVESRALDADRAQRWD